MTESNATAHMHDDEMRAIDQAWRYIADAMTQALSIENLTDAQAETLQRMQHGVELLADDSLHARLDEIRRQLDESTA